MESKPDKIKNEKNRVYTITVRFNKAEYKKMTEIFWKTGKYMGILAREATLEYIQTHFPDDETKT